MAMGIDIGHAEKAIQELLTSFGLGQSLPELQDTPARAAAYWAERLDGYGFDPASELQPISEELDRCPILLERIPFASTCEHHLAPFSGHVSLGYIPGDMGAVGLSKLIRLVHAFAHRLQMQERMTRQIFETLGTHLRPISWGVRVEAEHSCIAHRGVKIAHVPVTTTLLGGEWHQCPPSVFK